MHRDYMMIYPMRSALCFGRRSAFPREGDPMLYALVAVALFRAKETLCSMPRLPLDPLKGTLG